MFWASCKKAFKQSAAPLPKGMPGRAGACALSNFTMSAMLVTHAEKYCFVSMFFIVFNIFIVFNKGYIIYRSILVLDSRDFKITRARETAFLRQRPQLADTSAYGKRVKPPD